MRLPANERARAAPDRLLPLAGPGALVALLVAAALSALALACARGGAPEKRSGAVTILHTNDWHGHAFADRPPARGRERDRPPPLLSGGVAACAAAVGRIRAERPGAVLVLDGGDLLSGHPAADFTDGGVRGAAFVRLWAMIGYDAWAIGNHDLDHGIENLRALIPLARAPALSANLLAADGADPPVPAAPYQIFERGGLKIAVIGLITGELRGLLRSETLARLRVVPPVEAARPLVAELRPKVDLVVALTHLGIEADRELARAVPGIDAIVGGHSHTALRNPVREGATVIVQAGARGRRLGRLDLVVREGALAEHRWELLALPLDEAAVPRETLEASRALEARVAELGRQVVGETAHGLRRGDYYGETDCGSFVADAIRAAAGADVGFINSGGVRADLPRGKVTRADLLAVLPFDDSLASFEATGAELEAILRHNALAAATRDHGILQVSGVRYRWRRAPRAGGAPGAEIVAVEVGGKPLDRNRTYTCATNRFLLFEQPEKYFGAVPRGRRKLDVTIQDAVAAAFANGPVERPARGRIVEERAEPAAVPAGGPPAEGEDAGAKEQ